MRRGGCERSIRKGAQTQAVGVATAPFAVLAQEVMRLGVLSCMGVPISAWTLAALDKMNQYGFAAHDPSRFLTTLDSDTVPQLVGGRFSLISFFVWSFYTCKGGWGMAFLQRWILTLRHNWLAGKFP
jgi:hypothetical protein